MRVKNVLHYFMLLFQINDQRSRLTIFKGHWDEQQWKQHTMQLKELEHQLTLSANLVFNAKALSQVLQSVTIQWRRSRRRLRGAIAPLPNKKYWGLCLLSVIRSYIVTIWKVVFSNKSRKIDGFG